MGVVIAVLAFKGGCAKTTTSTNIPYIAAGRGEKVLVIDADQQFNTSKTFFPDTIDFGVSILDVVKGEKTFQEITREISSLIHLVPACKKLNNYDGYVYSKIYGDGKDERQVDLMLRNKIREIRDDYDYILIDCPPSEGKAVQNILLACDYILLPFQMGAYSYWGLDEMIDEVRKVRKNYRLGPVKIMILQTMFEKGGNSSGVISAALRNQYNKLKDIHILNTYVPRRRSVENTLLNHGTTIADRILGMVGKGQKGDEGDRIIFDSYSEAWGEIVEIAR